MIFPFCCFFFIFLIKGETTVSHVEREREERERERICPREDKAEGLG
ncbi:hypothetical protein ABFX02_02G036100 [Erythranthe guttata]